MSQYDVERVTGISQSRLSLLERAIRPMSADDADVLAQALAVSADQLIDRDHAA
jgi:transcriptional regulator with XRE-family HTH domain